MAVSIEELAQGFLTRLKEHFTKTLAPLEKRLAAVEAVQPMKGEKGEPGENGKDGKDGVDGKDGAPGADGKDGERGLQGLPGVDGSNGKDGIDGKDGAPGIGERGLPGKDGKDGSPGKDGEDGLDAVQIEIIDPDERRSYPRATYASWRGGIIRALRTTEPLAGLAPEESPEKRGWQIVVNGITAISVAGEDGRNFTLQAVTTSGKSATANFKVPTLLDRGVYKAGTIYETGDGVTSGGSFWVAQKATDKRPGDPDSDWRLVCKKGRDGKDGTQGPQGKPGNDGRAGRDLTQMLPDGRRF
jgi:integrin beta 3